MLEFVQASTWAELRPHICIGMPVLGGTLEMLAVRSGADAGNTEIVASEMLCAATSPTTPGPLCTARRDTDSTTRHRAVERSDNGEWDPSPAEFVDSDW